VVTWNLRHLLSLRNSFFTVTTTAADIAAAVSFVCVFKYNMSVNKERVRGGGQEKVLVDQLFNENKTPSLYIGICSVYTY